MTKNTKVYLMTFIFWAINLKLFYIISNWAQTVSIWKYSDGIISFYKSSFEYFVGFVVTIPVIALLLSILFSILLFIFWYYYFQVYFHKLQKVETEYTGVWGLLATIFTFLGFGCVACGQTLLSSVLLLFVSNGTMYFADMVGHLVMVFGILLLSYGIYKNYKILHDKNICKI